MTDGGVPAPGIAYLDNAATTLPTPEARKAVADAMERVYGNPSSLHALGIAAERALESSRRALARCAGVPESGLFFMGSGTEANNTAIIGACAQLARRARHVLTTRAEHASVLRAVEELARQGWDVGYVDVDANGIVDLGMLEALLRPDTALVALTHVNNETGAVQPVGEACRVRDRKSPGALVFVDCAQSFCKLPLEFISSIDIASFSSHKIHGPKGIAALYRRAGVRLRPLVFGGGQEGGLRSGTENVPGALGFAEAARALAEGRARNERRVAALAARLADELDSAGLRWRRIASGGPRSPYIFAAAFPGVPAEALLNHLSGDGVYVSTGSACSSRGSRKAGSHVLRAMGLPPEVASATIRISFSPFSTEADVDAAVRSLAAHAPAIARGRLGAHAPAIAKGGLGARPGGEGGLGAQPGGEGGLG